MAEFECRDENSHCLCDSIANLSSYLESGHPVNSLIPLIPTMKISEQLSSRFSPSETSSEQDSGGLDETDTLNQPEDRSPALDISSALRSVALKQTWDFGKMYSAFPKLLSLPTSEEDDSMSSSVADQNQSTEGTSDPVEDKVRDIFQSKYMNNFPLYQHYCLQNVWDDLHRLNKSGLSQLINPQGLQGLVANLSSLYPPEAVFPQKSLALVLKCSTPPNPIKVTPSTLWQDLNEVKASGLLSRLTTREIRLQETIFELIGSEASYLRSLQIAVTHFYASVALKQTLSQMEHHILFSNIQRVMAASEKFLKDLELRLGECVLISQVGDIVLQHCPAFHSLYVPYVTNMMYQEALVSQMLQQNKEFVYSLQKLERDPVCQRQSLKSFLVLPFQRITRIKLMLESILKLTEPDSDSFQNLEKAIGAIHEVVRECDSGVQKMKQIEELVCLEMLLDFGNVKGPVRQLIVDGTCNSRFISIYLHLFSDLLIISSKRDEQFIVLDHAEFPANVRTEHLKTKVLGLPSDSFLLHLSKTQSGQPTAMILVTDTSSAKDTWMNVLSSKQ